MRDCLPNILYPINFSSEMRVKDILDKIIFFKLREFIITTSTFKKILKVYIRYKENNPKS